MSVMTEHHYCHDQAVINRIWAKTILEELARVGVSEVCVAPGSRSTPLTLEADANSKLNLHTHFDERGLGFLALGLAKASKQPVAIIVTSGTAVANLLPAIAEAKLTGEKLVVLTADRPKQLVDCGANQAINQRGIFSAHVAAEVDLPSPSLHIPLKWLLTTIDQLMLVQQKDGSAIHINCPYPEPLYSDEALSLHQSYLDQVATWWQCNEPYTQKVWSVLQAAPISHSLASRKGVIVVGSLELHEAAQVKAMAQKLGWPLLADPQSGIRSDWAHFDLWLQNSAVAELLDQCEVVIQFGSRLVSKRLNQWLVKQVEKNRVEYHYVAPRCDRNNPNHLAQSHHITGVESWIEQFESQLPDLINLQSGWGDALSASSKQISHLAELHLSTDSQLSEIGLALSLNNLPEHTSLFLGNSLFVRLVDMFSQLDDVEVYSNRGASGIDGLIATASGVIRATQKPTLIQIGDTSLLYDLNSLALLSNERTPTVVLVTNNDGGAIFDLLPVPELQKQSLYQMPHGYDFESAAAQFKLPYCKPETMAQYQLLVEQHLTQGHGVILVEVQTPPGQASAQLQEFIQQVHAL